MGYTTTFKGQLEFNRELKASEIKKLKEAFEFDPRHGDHTQSSPYAFYYIDLELNENMDAIRWNGAEKSYGMTQQVGYVIGEITQLSPDLKLSGKMLAQGEDIDDRWELIVKDNKVTRKELKVIGKRIECPHCGSEFILESEEES